MVKPHIFRFSWCTFCRKRSGHPKMTCGEYPRGIPGTIIERAFADECPCGLYVPPERTEGVSDYPFDEADFKPPSFIA